MAECKTSKKISKYPKDADIICDKAGNILQYDILTNTWIFKGKISPPNIVTENENGLIDTTIYNKLQKLRTVYESNQINFTPLKLKPGVDGYWYYFRSSDKLYRFIPEAEDTLRIEVDRARIFQIALKQLCPGDKGAEGLPGPKGPTGASGAPEICYAPITIVNNQLSFAIYTPTPIIDSRISFRIYPVSRPLSSQTANLQNQLQYLTSYLKKYDTSTNNIAKITDMKKILIDNALGINKQAASQELSQVLTGTFSVGDSSLEINIDPNDPTGNSTLVSTTLPIQLSDTISTFKFVDNVLYGTVILSSSWSSQGSEWCLRSRQRGPKGDKGDPGLCRLSVVSSTIDNSNMLATCPIVNVRYDSPKNTLYWKCSDLSSDVCANAVTILGGAASLNDRSIIDSEFASAQMILDDCKLINKYKPSLPQFIQPELELVSWEPQPNCNLKRNFDRHTFNWQDTLSADKCNTDVKWYGVDDLKAPQYPYNIQKSDPPVTDKCCEDSFFFCPNVQDGPCIDNVIANGITTIAGKL
jgi:hypothetical protein